ncbi:hypothetical protein ACE3I8_21675, partial [Enterobacter hormaechei subsp. oharae]
AKWHSLTIQREAVICCGLLAGSGENGLHKSCIKQGGFCIAVLTDERPVFASFHGARRLERQA